MKELSQQVSTAKDIFEKLKTDPTSRPDVYRELRSIEKKRNEILIHYKTRKCLVCEREYFGSSDICVTCYTVGMKIFGGE